MEHGMTFPTTVTTEASSAALALVFCAVGSYFAVDFMARMHRGNGLSRLNWLFIVSIIHGASAWATQVLVADVAGGGRIGFDPALLFSALVVMLAFSTLGFALATAKAGSWTLEAGGAVLGAGQIVCYHAVAAACGHFPALPMSYDGTASSFALSMTFSAAATSVSARTARSHSTVAAAALLVLSAVVLLGGAAWPAFAVFSTEGVGAGRAIVVPSVVVIMSAVLGTALATYNIENQSRREAVETLRNLSMVDGLTGLANREGLKAHIALLAETTDKVTGKFAVFAFNLNRFRLVNDVHGSQAGDYILETVAGKLTAALGPGEFLSRVSGDEFYAVKSACHRKGDAQAFAAKLLEILREPIQWKSSRLEVSASIGGALFPADAESAEELIGKADLAMHRAKLAKSEEAVFFDPDIDRLQRDKNQLAVDLRMAIKNKEFEVHFQPQHSAADRRLVGFEALIRWRHPERGMISPMSFIPLAEETGMIVEIGSWVILESCMQAARWRSPLKLAVNVSAIQITRNDLPDIVARALASSGLDPRRLELEITESGLVADEHHAVATLNRLRALGCTVAMDDFGTGYSSLSMFKKIPFDKIKIDRAFISDLATNTQSLAIVNATIAVGRTLDCKVLAEGVEDERQLAILNEAGCNEVQGYFFGKPVPAADAEAIINDSLLNAPVVEASGKVVVLRKA
jgi:diguanylate cyclase (GGDEF)-like protein